MELRERICAYVADGNSARSAERLFGVSAATALRFAALHRENATAVPKPASSANSLGTGIFCWRSCNITLKELVGGLAETHGVEVQLSSLHRALERAGLSYKKGLIAPWVINGAMYGPAFDTYIETQLVPAFDPGTVVILDNLSNHKSPRAAQSLKERGCWFLFLPAYSPDLNPIEMTFSKFKAHLRHISARTFDTLLQALGDICDLFDPQQYWNFLKAAGYASD